VILTYCDIGLKWGLNRSTMRVSVICMLVVVSIINVHGKERVKCRTSLGSTWCYIFLSIGGQYEHYTLGCLTVVRLVSVDPGDWSEDNWILLYANSQPDQLDNPQLALYGSDWEAVKRDYPLIAKRALRVKRSLARHKYKVEKGKWTQFQPYTRICVPSESGLANAGLLPDDFVIRFNPTGPETDISADLFYKAFIRHGRVWNGYAGRSQH